MTGRDCALCDHPEADHTPRCCAWGGDDANELCGCPAYEPGPCEVCMDHGCADCYEDD